MHTTERLGPRGQHRRRAGRRRPAQPVRHRLTLAEVLQHKDPLLGVGRQQLGPGRESTGSAVANL
ncbi:hypothetical protein [Tsukamurella sp. PLM1]|uniref:hypothetical protein n=1 Tax=Tsukamurella sp. PLM1 TaxID=2929795 RepID=UPI0020C025E5|nr:hypothetical protein [Tsukamurella sp. PLM1]